MSVLLKTDRNKLNGQKTYLTTYLLTYLTCPPDPGESANSTIDDGNSARRTSNGNRVLEVFFVFVGLVLVSFSFCFGLVFDRHTHSFTHTHLSDTPLRLEPTSPHCWAASISTGPSSALRSRGTRLEQESAVISSRISGFKPTSHHNASTYKISTSPLR